MFKSKQVCIYSCEPPPVLCSAKSGQDNYSFILDCIRNWIRITIHLSMYLKFNLYCNFTSHFWGCSLHIVYLYLLCSFVFPLFSLMFYLRSFYSVHVLFFLHLSVELLNTVLEP